MHIRRFETALRAALDGGGGDGIRWAFCISRSYWQIAAEGTGEWEREVDRSDPIQSIYRSLLLFRIKM